jgi:tRNA(Ile)-lysidine synthase
MDEQSSRFRADLEALAGAAPGRLAVAVSGGADSLALLLLARAAYPGEVIAATVDHGLRREGAAEAAFVAKVCAGLHVPHAILAAGMEETANLQAAARARRYALLGGWAREAGAAGLLTAHHLEDQAETLLLRLLRGSGLAGLAAIRRVRPGDVPVYRPLLAWRRAELAAIVRHAGLASVADPSNTDLRFDRARLRRRLADTDWLDPVPLARSAGALGEAEAALAWATERLLEDRFDGEGLAAHDLPAELRRRLVLAVLARFGGPPPRGEAVARLLATLAAGRTATLAGVRCSGGAVWRFAPAPPRRR